MAKTDETTLSNGPAFGKAVPKLLLAAYAVLFAVCGWQPFDRAVWIAENAPIVLIVGTILLISRWHIFSPLAYFLMMCLVTLHTIGGHYTFERVPFDFVTNLFGFERNHYDRMAHFTVGFYAYPIAELLVAKRATNSRWVIAMFPLCAMMAVAAAYEIFEWRYAVSADPTAGAAVLGSQGDVWDAQEDMLADTLGALAVIPIFFLAWRREIRQLRGM